jgi:hypothetical protein
VTADAFVEEIKTLISKGILSGATIHSITPALVRAAERYATAVVARERRVPWVPE